MLRGLQEQFEPLQPSEPAGNDCVVCRGASGRAYWGAVWEHPMCCGCVGEWHQDAGVKAASALHYTADTAGAYRKATAAFVAARRRMAA